MVTSVLMLLKEKIKQTLLLQYGFYKAVITPQSLCAASLVLLLFNLQSTLTKHNTVSNEPEQAEEMHKDSKKLLFLLGTIIIIFVGIIFL